MTRGAAMAAGVAGLVLIACGGKGTVAETAGGDGGDGATTDAADQAAAPTTPAGAAPPYLLAKTGADGALVDAGSLAIDVRWADPPPALVRPGGLNDCGVRVPPPVSVHTLHGLRGAAVWLEGVASGIAPAESTVVELAARDCLAQPRIQVAPRLGAPLAVINDDNRRRQVDLVWTGAVGQSTAEPLAAVPLALVGQRYQLALERPGVVRADVGGAVGWVVVPAHPYYGLTDDKGRVAFEQVPPGRYRAVAWHPPVTDGGAPLVARAEIVVEAGKDVAVVLEPRPQ